MSVVIPALNEEENLQHVLPHIGEWVHEVVLVDGQSTDATLRVAQELRASIRLVHQAGKGKGDALRAGFEVATGDIIVMMDCDASTDPRELPSYIGALLAGADFAKGTRFVQGAGTADMPLVRRLGNRFFVLLVRLFFGGRYSDLCYGYNAFWRDTLEALQIESDGFEIETVMNIRALRAGLKVVEVASFEHARQHGKGRLRALPDGWRVLKAILHERLSPPPARPRVEGVDARQSRLGF